MGKVVKIVVGLALIAVAVFAPQLLPIAGKAFASAVIATGASIALSGVTEMLFAPKMPRSQLSRLNVSLDPSTPRKAVFGTTAMNLDLRYHETSGTDQEYVDYIIALAAHEIQGLDQIWFEESKAWQSGTGVTSKYSGYLTDVDIRYAGTSANYIAINGGSKWGSSRLLTGCAYVHLRIKRSGNSKKSESPLVQGLPSRVTIIGEGALLYDPRLDSTVPGGSGAHRSNNQATWGNYTDPDDCDNPALQLLWWLLGWKINNKLSIGCGVPPERIDMESFITAANICDESVLMATGSTQKRYRTSGTATDGDSRMDIINNFLACMNGTLRDNNGKLSLTVLKNDLSDWVLQLTDEDVLDEFKWDQTRGLSQSYNKVRGRYIDPSENSLYQLVEYPEIGFDSPDGIERVLTLDLAYVEDGRRAQRIAKQVLQRNQYRGMFSTVFSAKAMGCAVGEIVLLTFSALGWSNKPFRVISQEIGFDGRVPMALVEENQAIYAWDAEDMAPVTPTAPTVYDPLNDPMILGDTDAAGTAIDAIAPILFNANYQGVLDGGQLPKYITVIRRAGGVNVSASTTWSIIDQSGITGGTVTISSSGVITIPSGVSIRNSSSITVRSVRGNITLETSIGVTKVNASAPSTGTSGGTTVQDSSFTAFNSTSYVAISDLMTVKTGTAGQIKFSAPLTLNGTGNTNVRMKWRYRLVGGAFADAAAAVSSDPDPSYSFVGFPVNNYIYYPGSIECSPTLTGLTASTNYEVQLFALVDSAISPGTINASGTASAVGS